MSETATPYAVAPDLRTTLLLRRERARLELAEAERALGAALLETPRTSETARRTHEAYAAARAIQRRIAHLTIEIGECGR